ncbi:MAG: tetratricopeptide repeat protein [Acidobacteria bacterium]|nr:tetratricopeptide repeat protein [Acidobacteriota bacterium]MBV9923638.1 tetratricopeptide repeat protein [Acidobacteriota bacterium]
MPSDPRAAFRPLALLCWSLAAALQCAAQAPPPAAAQPKSLEQLREEYAVRFFEPEAHMALARYFRDAGRPLMAFNLLEAARRGRFEKEVFDKAFKTYFLGEKPFDNSAEAEKRLLAQLAQAPDSPELLFGLADIYISREEYAQARTYLDKLIAREPDDFQNVRALAQVYEREGKEAEAARVVREWASAHPGTADSYRARIADLSEKEPDKAKALLTEAAAKFPSDGSFPFYLAGIYLHEGNLKEAERLYLKAAELAPDSSEVQAWVGRFFFKAKPDDRRALEYYLRAYLLDPDAYETEYVESRIPQLAGRLADAHLRELLKGGAPLTSVVEDPDPYVVLAALEEMEKAWGPAYTQTLVKLMAHDDGGVRWKATEILQAKADASFDPTLKELLRDKDLRRRGLAAYIAVHRWKAASFEQMRQMLREEAQLLRFDAVSALFIDGGPEGRRIAFEHAAREPHPWLKKLIEKAKEQPPPE